VPVSSAAIAVLAAILLTVVVMAKARLRHGRLSDRP
jgi:hypothetical protein